MQRLTLDCANSNDPFFLIHVNPCAFLKVLPLSRLFDMHHAKSYINRRVFFALEMC